MDRFRLASAQALALALALSAAPASPNGRTPPRTSDLVVLKATCDAKSGDAGHEVFRARVVDAKGLAQSLEVRAGNTTEQLAIRDVKAITFAGDRVDANGFARATLAREGDDTSPDAPVMLRVRTEEGPLRLTGFKADGGSVRIDLLECRKVSFAPQRQGDGPSPRPGPARH